jgi:dTDP-4-amino-4,6-dideoxygalactose transaminase
VDIEPKYCNINPDKIKSVITPKTTAILPVHIYGNPCDVNKIVSGQYKKDYGKMYKNR